MPSFDANLRFKPFIGAIYLSGIIFTWQITVEVYGASVPLVVLVSPLISLLIGFSFDDLVRLSSIVSIATVITLGAQLQGIVGFDPFRVIAGFLLLIVALLAACGAIRTSRSQSWAYFVAAVTIMAWFQLVLQVLEISSLLVLRDNAPPHYALPMGRYSGFFAEPSHLAISYSPFILALAGRWWRIFDGRLRLWFWFPVIVTLALCPSATMLAVVVLALVFTSGRNIIVPFAIAAVLGAISLLYADEILLVLPREISDRISTIFDIVGLGYFDNRTNLSSLVFYGGARASLTVLQNYPLGVGFQNLAAAYSLPELLQYRYIAGDRNINDGGSIAFKMVGEFGVVGLVFWAWCMAKAFMSCHAPMLKETAFLAFPIVAFSIRGASYFDGPVLFAFATLISMGKLRTLGLKAKQSTSRETKIASVHDRY